MKVKTKALGVHTNIMLLSASFCILGAVKRWDCHAVSNVHTCGKQWQV